MAPIKAIPNKPTDFVENHQIATIYSELFLSVAKKLEYCKVVSDLDFKQLKFHLWPTQVCNRAIRKLN